VKFLVDMALSPDLAVWLWSQGHDAVHASDLALNRAADTQILSIALDGNVLSFRPTWTSPGPRAGWRPARV
jgi:predicted nuclease of predicted toxin-antitoxin system